jgi:hypothetical protein
MTLSTPDVTDDMRKSMGSPFNEFVLTCEFNQNQCNESSWTWYFDGYFGSCWSFNGGSDQNGTPIDTLESTKAGKWNGLSVM